MRQSIDNAAPHPPKPRPLYPWEGEKKDQGIVLYVERAIDAFQERL